MHVKDDVAYQFFPLIQSYIQEADFFATEYKLDEESPALFNNFSLKEGQSLDQLFKKKTLKKLDQLLSKQLGMRVHLFLDKTPFFIESLLAQSLFNKNQQEPLDHFLFNYAKEIGKEVGGIETIEEQIFVLQSMDLDRQSKTLQQTVEGFGKIKKQYRKLTKAYQEQNIFYLYKQGRKQLHQMRKVMLDNRNIIMANRIAAFTNTSSCFFAIGAAHLAGSKGVLRLLKKEGFKIKPIRLTLQSQPIFQQFDSNIVLEEE